MKCTIQIAVAASELWWKVKEYVKKHNMYLSEFPSETKWSEDLKWSFKVALH